jgi:hypothetical protein
MDRLCFPDIILPFLYQHKTQSTIFHSLSHTHSLSVMLACDMTSGTNYRNNNNNGGDDDLYLYDDDIPIVTDVEVVVDDGYNATTTTSRGAGTMLPSSSHTNPPALNPDYAGDSTIPAGAAAGTTEGVFGWFQQLTSPSSPVPPVSSSTTTAPRSPTAMVNTILPTTTTDIVPFQKPKNNDTNNFHIGGATVVPYTCGNDPRTVAIVPRATTTPNKIKVYKNLGRNPTGLQCPYCGRQSVTTVQDIIGVGTVVAVIVIAILFWPLCWLPFCVPSCKRTTHYCGHMECRSKIGETSACA